MTAHLGSGASLAAVAFGRSVDTTMGFTPLEGLVMATRSGTVDPEFNLWGQRHGGLSAAQVEDALEHDPGSWGCRSCPGISAKSWRQLTAAVPMHGSRTRLRISGSRLRWPQCVQPFAV